MIAANNGHVIAFDNISRMHPWLSDALCRLSTGGGFSTRELYSDSDEILIDVQCPIILNGIDDIATRQDLLDRSIVINLEPIPDGRRIAEAVFWEGFSRDVPHILSGIYNGVSRALKLEKFVDVSELPRMADFARWATAAEAALGFEDGEFLSVYGRNRRHSIEVSLEGSLVARAVKTLAERGPWTGSPTATWEELSKLVTEDERKSKRWPQSPNWCSTLLRRLATDLRATGIDIRFNDEPGKRRSISIEKVEKTASIASVPSESDATDGKDDILPSNSQRAPCG